MIEGLLEKISSRQERRTRGCTPPKTRIYAIGDIHGRHDLLVGLWERIAKDSAERGSTNVQIVATGDFIDRGPESARIIRRLRRTEEHADVKLHVLLGNHEWALTQALIGNRAAQLEWLKHGGGATLESFGATTPETEDPWEFAQAVADALGDDVIDWLRSRQVHLQLGTYFFCHAGITPGTPLAEQTDLEMLTIRDEFMESDLNHGAVVVHGHSRVDEVDIRHNRISLDTGAYETGVLSAVGLEDEDQWTITYSI